MVLDYASYSLMDQVYMGLPTLVLIKLEITVLKWETSYKFDLGIQFLDFFNDRITVEVDYFKMISKDLIFQLVFLSICSSTKCT